MNWIKTLLGAATFSVSVGSAQAGVTRYECRFEGDWMPAFLAIEHDTTSGSVKVFDDLIKAFVGTPIDGRITAETKVRTSISWQFRATSDTRQQTTLVYQINHYKDGRPAKLTMVPSGYSGEVTENGTCKVSRK